MSNHQNNHHNCIGIIETEGLAAALEAADIMLKTIANSKIELISFHIIGNERIAVIIQGPTGQVQTVVEAGANTAERKGKVLSRNVIPGCHIDLIKKLKKIGTDEEVANDDLLLDLLNNFKENIRNKKLKTAKENMEVFSNILQGYYQAAASSENSDLD